MRDHCVAVALLGASLLLIAASGCILPMATGTPQAATTVGHGRMGFALSTEAPTLDLLTSEENAVATQGVSFAGAGTGVLSYGLGDRTDLEVAGELAMYFFVLPIPVGGWAGIRHQLVHNDQYDVAVAARVGGVKSSASTTENDGTHQ